MWWRGDTGEHQNTVVVRKATVRRRGVYFSRAKQVDGTGSPSEGAVPEGAIGDTWGDRGSGARALGRPSRPGWKQRSNSSVEAMRQSNGLIECPQSCCQ